MHLFRAKFITVPTTCTLFEIQSTVGAPTPHSFQNPTHFMLDNTSHEDHLLWTIVSKAGANQLQSQQGINQQVDWSEFKTSHRERDGQRNKERQRDWLTWGIVFVGWVWPPPREEPPYKTSAPISSPKSFKQLKSLACAAVPLVILFKVKLGHVQWASWDGILDGTHTHFICCFEDGQCEGF